MGFELRDSGVVITGGAGGIGAAMAAEIAGVAVAGDAVGEAGVERLITRAVAELGAIDLYCANAGVAPHGGADAGEAAWGRAWEVNVMGHVRAADLLLPSWLDRGRFLATASAAGLLTMLGSAPYSVTKHAALAFAEWLSATYRHRGITVHALCPQGVRTAMFAEAGPGGQFLMGATAIEPEQVAEAVAAGLADDRFLILPHPEVAGYYQARAADTDAWIGNMNRLQRKIEKL